MIFVILASVLIVLMVGVLIAVGRIVYKDAKALGMNATLWTLLALFLPNFVGVIIYLVVRSNTPKVVKCSKCQSKVKESYNVCPECGSHFTAFCAQCKKPVEPGMKLCPYCGEDASGLGVPAARKLQTETHIGKSLGVTLAVFFGVMILVLGSMVTIGVVTDGQGFNPDLSIMNIETNYQNRFKNSFGYRDGKVRAKFTFDDASEKAIVGAVRVDRGSVTFELQDEEGNRVLDQVFEASEEVYDVHLDLREYPGTKYKLFIYYTEAKGEIELQGK